MIAALPVRRRTPMSAFYNWPAHGHRLRATRAALGITEQQAADAFGVMLQTYRRYEAGCRVQSVLSEVRFAKKFGVLLDWLIDGAARPSITVTWRNLRKYRSCP